MEPQALAENCKNCKVEGAKGRKIAMLWGQRWESNLTEIPIVAITSSSPDILGIE
jgi:hypothetical protein